MTPRPNSPDDHRNRKGCFIIIAILTIFVGLYLFVGFHAQPGNDVAQSIPTVPAR